MTFADEPQLRTVTVTYRPSTFGDKIVRFQGSTFGELQQRLIAARVPHVHSMSFVELYSPSEGFVCPLASEALPDVKDLTIAVHGESFDTIRAAMSKLRYLEISIAYPWRIQTCPLLFCSGQNRSQGPRVTKRC